jgi:hypothetical protein
MKIRQLAILGTSAILAACIPILRASAQETAATGNSEASLASGTPIYAELSSGLDSRKLKVGDAVMAHLTEPVKSADGRTILSKGTKIAGHIAQASARAKGGGDSTLGIAFDKAILKDGQDMPLNVAIQALAAPVSFSAPADLGTPPSTGTTQTSPVSGGSRNGPSAQTRPQSGIGSGDIPAQGGDSASNLGPGNRGVYGLSGLKLGYATANGKAPVSVVTSDGKNVHLESGTRLLLVAQAVGVGAPGQ